MSSVDKEYYEYLMSQDKSDLAIEIMNLETSSSNNRIAESIKENDQLKQQLHDLPKKIVEEIIEELCDCGKTYLQDEPYIEICIVKGILDTILKKYGEGNE